MAQKHTQKNKSKDDIKQVVYCTMNGNAKGYFCTGIIDLLVWVLKTAPFYLFFHLYRGLCDRVAASSLSSSELPPF